MTELTNEDFQAMIWGQPIIPSLPVFERKILIKHGVNIRVNTTQRKQEIEFEQNKLTRGYGKKPKELINTTFGKVLDWKCKSRIRGVVTSLNVAETHKGQKVLEAVIVKMLTDEPTIHSKMFEWDYGYSRMHASTYMKAIEFSIKSINMLELEDKPNSDN
jgi:hypothetical protein|tara:strand:- start:404 stop:883 length:480 start_codon:yes stop_codon:yes gene_type:complete